MSELYTRCEVLYSGGAVQIYLDTAPTTVKGPKGDPGTSVSGSFCEQPVYDQDDQLTGGILPNVPSDPPVYDADTHGATPVIPNPSPVDGEKYIDLASGILYERQAGVWVQIDTLSIPPVIAADPLLLGTVHHIQETMGQASSHVWDGAAWNEMYQMLNYDGGVI